MSYKDKISVQVLNRVQKYEIDSEKFIAFSQIWFLVAVGLLYILSPTSSDTTFALTNPVIIVLGLFFLLVFARLILVQYGKLKGAFIDIFIVLDIAMLTGLIWSYHLQYEMEIGFSLRSPTFVFFFFLITLRVLRFNIRYIIVSTVSSIIAWTILLFFATRGSSVIHSYIQYTLSNDVLIGVEVEKMVAILCCGAILALSVYRSRSLLIYSQQQQEAVTSLARFFSPTVVSQISGEHENILPGTGKKRSGVIMSIDIRSFSIFSAEHSPDVVMSTLSEYQSHLIPIILNNGGSIDKFMGDGILIHFGVVDESPQYAANAMRAAENIIDALSQWNRQRAKNDLKTLNIGIGISGGDVMFGTVGNDSRLEFTIIGHAVDVAVKLEKFTKKCPGSIIVLQSIYELATTQGFRPHFHPYKISNRSVLGIKDSLNLVMLLSNDQKQLIDNSKDSSAAPSE